MSFFVAPPRLEYGDSHSRNVPVSKPRLSWKTTADASNWVQVAAELRLRLGSEDFVNKVDGDQSVFVAWPFKPLSPRDRGTVQVRVFDGSAWSEWSEPQSFTASFLSESEWVAETIGLATPSKQAQPVLLRTEFEVKENLTKATLYATAQGVYQAHVNGLAVDDQVLKPGWTHYQDRLVHETTDVTDKLKVGANAIGVSLAGGWFTEKFGFQGLATPFYGEQPSFAGQLLLEYADGSSTCVATDATWKATGKTPWISAGIYFGEDFDARKIQPGWDLPGFDDSSWSNAQARADLPVPEARVSPEARVVDVLPVKEVLTSPSGATIVDFGQNLVGRLRIRVTGEAGETITLRHAEVLDEGELGIRPLRTARATDTYILRGDPTEEYAPQFTFHGFRYAEIAGWPGKFDPTSVTAEVISSDMRRTGWFNTSNPLLNRLHENVVWGMRGNFLYLPTDCPQRDERLGWTGDIQIFGPTASFLFDCDGFLSSWLKDVWLDQQEAEGGVPFVVPDVLVSAGVPTAAWGDVTSVLPSVLWERFEDRDVLQNQYASMKAWTDFILDRAGERHLWEGGFQFGDWVDPDSPPENPAKAKTDTDLVASSFLYLSTKLVSKVATELGHESDAEFYAKEAETIRTAWLNEYSTPAGRVMSDSQTAYALAIQFGIAEGDLKRRMGDRLAVLVRQDGYRISTGFVGTPLVADALSKTGHLREAGRLVMQTERPSWLYSVLMGATTVWERWDSLLPDGTINPGEMTSFNHYALGSIADWLHRAIGGISPEKPGYKVVRIAPSPIDGIDSANTTFDSPYGLVRVNWKREGQRLHVVADIPANASALVQLPGTAEFQTGSGHYEWVVDLEVQKRIAAPLTKDTKLIDIIDDQVSFDALMTAFDRVTPYLSADFKARTRWLPAQTLGDSFALAAPTVADRVLAELEGFNATRKE